MKTLGAGQWKIWICVQRIILGARKLQIHTGRLAPIYAHYIYIYYIKSCLSSSVRDTEQAI